MKTQILFRDFMNIFVQKYVNDRDDDIDIR